jgi:sialate O-acetylesterase
MQRLRFSGICMLCLLLAVSFPVAAQLRLIRGATDYQVFQRDAENKADLALYGDAYGEDGKEVEARVLRIDPPRQVKGWSTLGTVTNGRWTGVVAGVPTGGPYTLEVRVKGSEQVVRAVNLLVGDLWVLAGQSNMEGIGDMRDLEPSNPLVNSFDMGDNWTLAKDPLHILAHSLDRVHWDHARNPDRPNRLRDENLDAYFANLKKGAGLGLPFAAEMVRLTGVPVGLIPCAHGGTSMDQWDPAKKNLVGDSLYGSMYRRIQAMGGRVAGILWYQGESDATEKAAPLYKEKFSRFIAAVRSDLNQPNLPFYYAQIGLHVNPTGHDEWDVVQEAERQLEMELSNVGMVSTIDSELDDAIHASVESLKVIGHRFARLACHDLFPSETKCQGFERGPRPVRAERIAPTTIRLELGSVNGSVTAAGKMSGFSVLEEGTGKQYAVFKVTRDPANASALLIWFQGAALDAKLELYYAKGRYSYANIVDEANMALPAFGPMKVK